MPCGSNWRNSPRNGISLAWLWGPQLYRTDRIRFRPFTLAHWGGFFQAGLLGVDRVAWSGTLGKELDRWLAEVDANDDIELFRRLMALKNTPARAWRPDAKVLLSELQGRLDRASLSRMRIELEKFDLWGFELNEDAALSLYRRDRNLTGTFILKHLAWSSWWGEQQRTLWERLHDEATKAGDDRLADGLYQRQVPLKRWHKDVLTACAQVPDPAALCAILDRRHPKDLWRNLGDPFIEILEKRGRDVLPYVRKLQGAPTSPGLCNAIVLRMDRRLLGLARKFGVAYTRYADDLTSRVISIARRPSVLSIKCGRSSPAKDSRLTRPRPASWCRPVARPSPASS